jgi:hypothetical protein
MNIAALTKQSRGDFHFVGLSRASDDLKSFLSKDPPAFPVFVDRTGAAGAALGYLGTPQTVVLSKDGEVIHNWIGAYEGPKKASVESFFGVNLPGLLPEESGR